MVHKTKADALSQREFEQLVAATYQMDRDYFEMETRMVVFAAGRLGMRAGEIAHMDSEWIDFRRGMISIPHQDDCHKGVDGGPCGACRQAAKLYVDIGTEETIEDGLQRSWTPKTESAARDIPLDTNERAELAIETYFSKYDKVQCSRQGINRRVNKAAEIADELDEGSVYPHALRATAATHYASRGLEPLALQSLFGWADFSTAHHYIQTSGERTARMLRDSLS